MELFTETFLHKVFYSYFSVSEAYFEANFEVFINASLRQRTITLVVEAFYSIFFSLCLCGLQ